MSRSSNLARACSAMQTLMLSVCGSWTVTASGLSWALCRWEIRQTWPGGRSTCQL
jgi:hypothetical protein